MIYYIYQDSFTFSSAIFVSAHVSDEKIENNPSRWNMNKVEYVKDVNKIYTRSQIASVDTWPIYCLP